MLKSSLIDSRTRRHLVLEGALTSPWITELKIAWEKTFAGAQDLALDLKNIIHISANSGETLSELMSESVRLSAGGVFTKHILRKLTRPKGSVDKPGRTAAQTAAVSPNAKEAK